MLDYIKREIASRRGAVEIENKPVEPEAIPDTTILEYAHLFQELDDLSAEGTDASTPRSIGAIDIPLDDDIEIETVEVSLKDGRITDVPGDATASSVNESYYDNLKKYDEFVVEAAGMITQLPRETDDAYNARVSALADKLYTEYSDHMALVTNNAFEKISMESDEVPSSVKINFGKADDSENAPSFMTKVKTFFDVDKGYRISRKQLDSLKLAVNGGFQRMVPALKAYVESACTIPEGLGLWDVCTPTKVIVPKGTNDTFCVVLEYTNEITGKDEYFGWTASTQKNGVNVVQEAWNPMTKDDVKSEIKDVRETWEKISDRKGFDKDKVNKLIDKLEAKVLDMMSKDYDLLKIEGGNFYLYPKAWKGLKLNDKASGVEYKMWIGCEIGAQPEISYDKFDSTGRWIGDSSKTVGDGGKFVKDYAVIDLDSEEKINMESFVSGNYVTREQAISLINEAAIESNQVKAVRPMPTRSYFQEAIDFGSDSAAPPDGDDAPPAPDEAAPSVDINAEAGSDTDVSTDNPSDAADTNVDAADKATADVNDVSSEIAEKVAAKTENENPSNDNMDSVGDDFDSTEPTFDDNDLDMDSTDSTDMGTSADDQLDELDNLANGDSEGSDDMSADLGTDVDDADFDNMTIDQIIESGSEKLKGMTLEQIKSFIKDNPSEAVQEAFFITKKNVDKELDAKIRDCLGILNDNKMTIEPLVKAFKSAGAKLNRVLSKAVRLRKVYNEKEIKAMRDLNTALVGLLTQLRKAKDSRNVDAVKRQILVFTSAAKEVAKIVEDRLGAKTVQEAALIQEGVFLTPNNVKRRLAGEIKRVYADLKAISDAYSNDRLTRGKINKIYRAGTKSALVSAGTGSKTKIDKTAGYRNLDDLMQTLNKVVRKKAIRSAFNNDEMSIIDEMLDLFDEYIDGVEGIVYDDASGDVKTIVQNIGKVSSKLIEKLSEFYGICSEGDTLEDAKAVEDTSMPEDSEEMTEDSSVDNMEDLDAAGNDDDTSSEDTSTNDDEGSDDVEGIEDDESLTDTEDEDEENEDSDEGDEE